jgi:glucose-6-phosphate 1-dehydrogenase
VNNLISAEAPPPPTCAGRDTASFDVLNACTSSLFDESQLFRIDHYLGKEVIQNITALRFCNQLFEPLWNKVRQC